MLVCYAALSFLQILLMFLEQDTARRRVTGESVNTIMFAFMMLKMVVYIAALLIFVVGLQSLRLGTRPASTRPSRRPRDVDDESESGASDPEEATRKLALAQQLIDQDRRDDAIEALEELLNDYPSTNAAITAHDPAPPPQRGLSGCERPVNAKSPRSDLRGLPPSPIRHRGVLAT